jgi:hypothetical protein
MTGLIVLWMVWSALTSAGAAWVVARRLAALERRVGTLERGLGVTGSGA